MKRMKLFCFKIENLEKDNCEIKSDGLRKIEKKNKKMFAECCQRKHL